MGVKIAFFYTKVERWYTHSAMLLPEVLNVRILIPISDFKWQSSKDNFHNFILGIEKMVTLGIVNSTIPIYFPSRGAQIDSHLMV